MLGKGVDLAETVEMFSYNSDLDPYVALDRVLFFACLLHICVLVFRLVSVVVIKFFDGASIPVLCIFPRIEIYVAFWTIPAIAAASARLLTHSKSTSVLRSGGIQKRCAVLEGLILGCFLLVLIPGMFFFILATILYTAFFKCAPEDWRVTIIRSNPNGDQPPDAETDERIETSPTASPSGAPHS